MLFLYYVYAICIALPILLVLTILTAAVTIIGSLLGDARVWGYYPGKVWSILICFFLFIPVKVSGREKVKRRTSYIFVANHQGAFDIFLIYGFMGRNFKWMMKQSLRNIPLVGKACESAGHIFVERGASKKVFDTIAQAERTLVNGVSLVVFPEGARSHSGRLGTFKRGAYQLADDLQLPVVPMTINGSFDILPRTRHWLRPHKLSLTIHDPIPPQGKGVENLKQLMTASYDAIESGLDEKYRSA
jgi:1-acyl-sn-glycerol-3-phosphate acyltransferase